MSSDDLIGRVIDGRYRIEAEIGEGGMGIVYRCRHVRLEKDSAIKILRRDHGHSEDVVRRFLKEARLASSIKHPHVVDLSDCGELPEGGAYYVMELLAGEALADTLARERRVPPEDAFDLMLQVIDGLSAAHAMEIVHRDLKPENVFLTETADGPPHVKLLDFGIARAKDSKDTLPGTVLGTPEYMAPEQALGIVVDTRADLYALGVMLFELLTGRVPLYASDLGELIRLKLEGTPLRLTQGAPDLAAMVFTERLIADLLARDPNARVPTIAEVKRRLLEARERDLASAPAPESRQTRGIGSGKLTSPAANTAYVRAVEGGWQRPGTRLPSVAEPGSARGGTVHAIADSGAFAAGSGARVAVLAIPSEPPARSAAALPQAVPRGGRSSLAVPLIAGAAVLAGALSAVLMLDRNAPAEDPVDVTAPEAAIAEPVPAAAVLAAPAPSDPPERVASDAPRVAEPEIEPPANAEPDAEPEAAPEAAPVEEPIAKQPSSTRPRPTTDRPRPSPTTKPKPPPPPPVASGNPQPIDPWGKKQK